MYADDLALCGESEEDLSAMMEVLLRCVKKKVLKFNASRSKVMVLGGEEGLEFEVEVCVDEIRLKHVSEFKYLGCVLDESGTDEAECRRKVASGVRVSGAIKSLVNVSSLQLESATACMNHC